MSKKADIQSILNTLSKEELVELIIDAAERDELLLNRIKTRYAMKQKGKSKEKDTIKAYTKRINQVVKTHTNGGFISRKGTGAFAADMVEILTDSSKADDVLVELEIAILILEETVTAVAYADDSDGDLQYIGDGAIGCVQAVVDEVVEEEPALRKKCFDRIIRCSYNPIFENWNDWIEELWVCCMEFADLPELREQLIQVIEARIENLQKKDAEYQDYEIQRLKRLLLDLIEDYGDEADAQRFLQDNMELSDFRQLTIDRYLEEGQAEAALTLAEEGEAKDTEWPGLVHQWKKARYAAYQALNRTEDERALAEELFFAGEYSCYADLERLAGDQKDELYARIKRALSEKQSWHAENNYIRLIEEKNDLPAQLEYITKYPMWIEDYAEKLAETYREEILAIYSQHILDFAHAGTNRKKYWVTARKIERYAKLAGKEGRDEMIRILSERYPKRIAMLDELSRVK